MRTNVQWGQRETTGTGGRLPVCAHTRVHSPLKLSSTQSTTRVHAVWESGLNQNNTPSKHAKGFVLVFCNQFH